MTDTDIKEITETRDGRKFTRAGFKYMPAGGGMYSWQKRLGDIVLQACDWETDSPFYLVGALHDDGSTLAANGEYGVDEALRLFIELARVPRSRWEPFASKNWENYTFM